MVEGDVYVRGPENGPGTNTWMKNPVMKLPSVEESC